MNIQGGNLSCASPPINLKIAYSQRARFPIDKVILSKEVK